MSSRIVLETGTYLILKEDASGGLLLETEPPIQLQGAIAATGAATGDLLTEIRLAGTVTSAALIAARLTRRPGKVVSSEFDTAKPSMLVDVTKPQISIEAQATIEIENTADKVVI